MKKSTSRKRNRFVERCMNRITILSKKINAWFQKKNIVISLHTGGEWLSHPILAQFLAVSNVDNVSQYKANEICYSGGGRAVQKDEEATSIPCAGAKSAHAETRTPAMTLSAAVSLRNTIHEPHHKRLVRDFSYVILGGSKTCYMVTDFAKHNKKHRTEVYLRQSPSPI